MPNNFRRSLGSELLAQYGPQRMQSMVGNARGEGGVTPTNVDPRLKLRKEELAPIDRFAQFAGIGEDMGVLSPLAFPFAAAGAVGAEAIKTKPIASIMNMLPVRDELKVDTTSTQPSLDNIRGALSGYWEGAQRNDKVNRILHFLGR